MVASLAIREPLTVSATLLYLALFFYIYIQLILVLVYGHKRWCYRTFLLYTCAMWAGLRVTLFSYYCYLEHNNIQETIPELSRHVGTASYFILFSMPIVRSTEDRYQPTRWRSLSGHTAGVVVANIVVFVTNLTCAILIKEAEHQMPALTDSIIPSPKLLVAKLPGTVPYVIYIRVFINGLMFIAMAAALAYLIVQVAKTAEVRLLLETEDMTQAGARSVGILLVTLYLCRTVANILALVPNVGWVYDTDQVDLLSDSEYGYYTFITVQFLWEYLPTLASVVFFRVKKPVLLSYPPILEPMSRSGNRASESEDDGSFNHYYPHHYLHPHISFQQASDTWFSNVNENNAGDTLNPSSRTGSHQNTPHSPAHRFLYRYMGYRPYLESQ
ncbi:Integral membrane protein GPR137B-like [Homarus americanus]|uniref:Integral membrane protein GPR137B-like n=1 Tax=Homarus americanus TaxID=6706 RepID=A0A8J5JZ14_HOMAM|nr:Integral membrane protein GPR137B-like [Homarus americanus]